MSTLRNTAKCALMLLFLPFVLVLLGIAHQIKKFLTA